MTRDRLFSSLVPGVQQGIHDVVIRELVLRALHAGCMRGVVMKLHSRSLFTARRRIPFFPFIPLVPIALMLANLTALVTLFRRVRRVEARASAY